MSEIDVDKNSVRIVSEMLSFRPPPNLESKSVKAGQLDWGLSRETASFILNDPNAFLIGSIFNYLIPYRKAWEAPVKLKRRLGHLDVEKMAAMDVNALCEVIRGVPHEMSLHRFPLLLARKVIAASDHLVKNYGASAANIWPDGSSAANVLLRVQRFDGISQKIGNMMTRLLGTWFGVHLTNWERIDIAVDRHVKRVFRRSGLISAGTMPSNQAVIERARVLCPDFPGMLDDPAFLIGVRWCTENGPLCDVEIKGSKCPLALVCPKCDLSRVAARAGTPPQLSFQPGTPNADARKLSSGNSSRKQPLAKTGGMVRWNPTTLYRDSKVGTATYAIYEYVSRKYPEWVDISTLVDVARNAGHTGNTDNYVRNTVIPYAVEAKHNRLYMVRE